MPQHVVKTHYFSGQGVVMLADRDQNGQPLGFVPVGNVSELKLTVEESVEQHRESMSGLRSVDFELVKELNVNVQMTLESIDQKNLALALRGSSASVNAATNKTVTLTAEPGKIYDLGALNLSNWTVKNSTDPTIVYEDGKNFRMNEKAGSIYIFTADEQTAAGATHTITAATQIDVTFDHTGFLELEPLTVSQVTKWLRFEGLNTVEDPDLGGFLPVVVDIFKWQVKPLAELALIQEGIAGMQVEGPALSDPLRTTGSKFFRIRSLA